MPVSTTFEQNKMSGSMLPAGFESKIFLTNLAASRREIPVPLNNSLADVISLSMVLIIPMSTPNFKKTFEVFDS